MQISEPSLGDILAFLSNEGYIASMTMIVGVIGWLVSLRRSIRMERRQNTVRLLAAFQENELLCEADAYMASVIRAGVPVDPLTLSRENDIKLMRILDFYELLSASAREGYLDIKVVRKLRGGAMRRSYLLTRDYVAVRSKQAGTGFYKDFTWLASSLKD